MTLCCYGKHGNAFQNSIILELVPGAGLCQGTMPATQGKAVLSNKQPEHQCHSQGLKDQLKIPSHSSFQLQTGLVTQKS